MKKSAYLAAALLAAGALFSTTAHAQVRFGIKGGLTNSRIAGRFYQSYRTKFGFHAGVLANIDVTGDGFFSVQPELLYSQKGFTVGTENTFTIRDSGVTQTVTFKDRGTVNYNYIDLPVLLRINARGLIFEAGPQLSYLITVRNNVKSTANGTSTSNAYWGGKVQDARRTEWGYAAGLGYQFAAGPLLGLRYNGSFTEFGRNSSSTSEFDHARNAAYQFYVGYLFGGN